MAERHHLASLTKNLTDPPSAAPGYWMFEISGQLAPAVRAYLEGGPLDQYQIALLRAYLRQWIDHPGWRGIELTALRQTVDTLRTRRAIAQWIDRAVELGIDPL